MSKNRQKFKKEMVKENEPNNEIEQEVIGTNEVGDELENDLNLDPNVDIDSDLDFDTDLDTDIEPDLDLDDDLDFDSGYPTDEELEVESNDDSISNIPPNDSQVNESQDVGEEAEVLSSEEMSNPTQKYKEADFTVEDLVPVQSKLGNRITGAGVLTIVNSVKNGKRMAISSEVYKGLGKPTSAQIGFLTSSIVIGNDLPDDFTTYELKIHGQKAIVYNTDLVKLVTSHFGLDFSERTSITFPKADYQVLNGNVIAIIDVK